MKPETADYLAQARECLDAAIQVNTFPLPQIAAKEAYLAAFHAVHAFVFETTGKIVKTHRGMRTMFALLTRDDPRMDSSFPSLLARLYKFKEVADYAVGSLSVVTVTEAEGAIDIGRRFVVTITEVLSSDPASAGEPRESEV
ncbi:MAG: HEPN domain-containing protein [Acetobacteraceae bacterium]|nr:HEPN domain-containing protein [Acetobacteraceae bacterium]